jgi:hypothetical protein
MASLLYGSFCVATSLLDRLLSRSAPFVFGFLSFPSSLFF